MFTDKQSEPYKEGYEVGVKLAPHRDKFPEVVSVPVRWASDPGPRRADGWTEAAHAYVDGVQDGWTDNYTPQLGARLVSDIATELDTEEYK